MYSFDCQICGADMATARIRTTDEPYGAAWDLTGANYVGFSDKGWQAGVEAAQQECEECTNEDRTPKNPRIGHYTFPDWPDGESEGDREWVLDSGDSDEDRESLEYSSELEDEAVSGRDDHDGGEEEIKDPGAVLEAETNRLYPLSDMFDPEQLSSERHRHGAWHHGLVFYSGNRKYQIWEPIRRDHGSCDVPREHIASPSCRNPQGINGHALSVAQMKNCRNVRYLVPKPVGWRTEESDDGDGDGIIERESLFFLSGESNGSNLAAGRHYIPWRSFHPPRHGLRELQSGWDSANEACHELDVLRPLPAHSYCLDVYAKASYLASQRVDLDGLWHWREVQASPEEYGIEVDDPLLQQTEEVRRGRARWDSPWHHLAGDEWLAANPVEVPDLHVALASCRNINHQHGVNRGGQPCGGGEQPGTTGLLHLPTEIIQHILSFLDVASVEAVARTCPRLNVHSQYSFKAFVARDMPWLWELLEDGNFYPASRDWPTTWDPLCPPGLQIPRLPVGLEDAVSEERLWAAIVEEDPEMEAVGEAVKTINQRRREDIMAPYHMKQEAALCEWRVFRGQVGSWIRSRRHRAKIDTAAEGEHGDDETAESLSWRRVYWLCHPTTTPLPGLRNRARIWDACQRILRCVSLACVSGEIGRRMGHLVEKATDPSQPGWDTDLDADGL